MRHTALPSPGSPEQLRALAARIHSQRLDRAKPLWELWLVQGLEDNRFALISKTHHAIVDGVSGVDLMTVLFDLSPVPQSAPHEGEPWVALPRAARRAARRPRASRACSGCRWSSRTARSPPPRTPARSLDEVKEALEGIGEVAWAGLNPAPETPLNVADRPAPPTVLRRATTSSDFKLVKNTLGGTVNDVVLTVVAGGLRTWLRARGVRTEGLELRALVPVSVRTKDDKGQLGNRIVVMRGPLPVYVEDPVARLRVVRQAMDGLKESKQAVGAAAITGLEALAPPTILAQASRLQFSTRLFNLLVTNVPGPQFPIYVLGRELLDTYPIAFLPENQSLAVAVMSYNGGMDFGLLGDYDNLHRHRGARPGAHGRARGARRGRRRQAARTSQEGFSHVIRCS